jgi:branched-chain amino acid transport system substrate-binding protein
LVDLRQRCSYPRLVRRPECSRCRGSRAAHSARRAASLALLAVATACSPGLRVGVVLPETGEAAAYGASIKSGIKLAFGQAVTARHAPPGLELLFRDSGSDPTRAAGAAEGLYEAGVLAVIGGVTSAEATVMIPVAARFRRVLLSPSASAPELARISPFFFRVYPSDELEGVEAAEFLTTTRNCRTVLILQEDNAYTRGLLPVFARELASQGTHLVGSLRLDEEGWDAALRRASNGKGPDGVYLCGYGDVILAGLRALRTMGYRGTICTTSAISASSILQRAGALAEGIFFPLAGLDLADPHGPARAFVEQYRAAYNLPPDIYAAHGYDAMEAIIAALNRLTERRGSALPAGLRALTQEQGVTGPIAFDEDGNIRQRPRTYWIHNGKVEDVSNPLARPGA